MTNVHYKTLELVYPLITVIPLTPYLISPFNFMSCLRVKYLEEYSVDQIIIGILFLLVRRM